MIHEYHDDTDCVRMAFQSSRVLQSGHLIDKQPKQPATRLVAIPPSKTKIGHSWISFERDALPKTTVKPPMNMSAVVIYHFHA